MRLLCSVGLHHLQPIGDGYVYGPEAECRPMRCSRCAHEELTTIWRADKPGVIRNFLSVFVVFGSLALVMYIFRDEIASWIGSLPKI